MPCLIRRCQGKRQISVVCRKRTADIRKGGRLSDARLFRARLSTDFRLPGGGCNRSATTTAIIRAQYIRRRQFRIIHRGDRRPMKKNRPEIQLRPVLARSISRCTRTAVPVQQPGPVPRVQLKRSRYRSYEIEDHGREIFDSHPEALIRRIGCYADEHHDQRIFRERLTSFDPDQSS